MGDNVGLAPKFPFVSLEKKCAMERYKNFDI